MINEDYKQLKFKRTYLGGSEAKELEIFKYVQDTDGNGTCDWLEYRRILFPYIEDELHVNFSRSYLSERLSYVLLGLSFVLGLSHLIILSLVILSMSIALRALHFYFKHKIKETQLSHNLSLSIVKRQIKNLIGLDI